MRMPREVAGFDSATGMVVALARFLRGLGTPPLGNPRLRMLRPAAALLGRTPVSMRQFVYSVFSGAEGRPEEEIATLDADDVFRQIAAIYPRRRYPAVVIGSSGGALIHLCAALGVPWLPQTVLLPVRQRGLSPDEPRRAAEAFDRTARALLDRNPDVVLHHMHDPVQDRLTLRRIAYFRVKRTRLGRSYEEFLDDMLEPGGTVLLAECGQTWPISSRGDRHLFQFGAVGGLPPHEYVDGSARVRDYLRRYRAPVERWEAPPANGTAPEAEWGFETGLRDDVQRFAKERGYRVARLVHDEPEDLSPLVADLYRSWYRRRGLPADRLLIESFMLMDPWWTLRTGSVPYWTLFPVRSSLDRLHRYLDSAETYDFLHLGLFCHGVESPGSVSAAEWRDLLGRAGVKGAFAGVSPRRYPADPGTFFEFPRALRAIPRRHPLPEPLTLDEVFSVTDGRAHLH